MPPDSYKLFHLLVYTWHGLRIARQRETQPLRGQHPGKEHGFRKPINGEIQQKVLACGRREPRQPNMQIPPPYPAPCFPPSPCPAPGAETASRAKLRLIQSETGPQSHLLPHPSTIYVLTLALRFLTSTGSLVVSCSLFSCRPPPSWGNPASSHSGLSNSRLGPHASLSGVLALAERTQVRRVFPA